jgi:hypothetical protein
MTAATRSRPVRPVATYDHLMKRKRATKTLYFTEDDDLRNEFLGAQNAYAMAQMEPDDKVSLRRAKTDLEKITARLKGDPESIGNGKYERLMREFPPSDKQLEDWESTPEKYQGAKPQYDEDKFFPALLAATAREPEMTVEQATELCDEWTSGDIAQLVGTAIQLCNGGTSMDLNLGN